MAKKIYVVSVGPGSIEYITPLAHKIISEAKYIAGGERNLKPYIDDTKNVFIIKNNLTKLKIFLLDNIANSPVVLASGDAGFYGILKYLQKEFSKEMLVVIPGVSSIQIAFARLSDTWHDATLLSAHGRPFEDIIPLFGTGKLVVLTDAKNTPQQLAQHLLEKAIFPIQIVVLNNLTYQDEYIWRGKAQDLATLEIELHNSVVVIYNE